MAQFTTTDGARLHYVEAGTGLPVLALAGLTRSGGDFDDVAPHLADVHLVRLDSRGRGGSDWTGAHSYTVPQEAADVLALMDHLGLEKVAILGTSRGGLLALALAALAPHRLRGICFNDIGPEIEREGLARIGEYIGRRPPVRSFDQMAERLARAPGFGAVPEGRWLAAARRQYRETPEGLELAYDPELRAAFLAGLEAPLPDLWPFFDACAGLPLAVIRGANSDLLLRRTVEAMAARRPDLIRAEVPDRGHVPFLDEPEALAAIRLWLDRLA